VVGDRVEIGSVRWKGTGLLEGADDQVVDVKPLTAADFIQRALPLGTGRRCGLEPSHRLVDHGRQRVPDPAWGRPRRELHSPAEWDSGDGRRVVVDGRLGGIN
jgi:hypothetical protein